MTIIGLSGKKHSGKDSTADIILQEVADNPNIKAIKIAYAGNLKLEVSHAFGLSVEFIEINKEHFRPLLQAWGVLKRYLFGEDYWIKRLDKSINYITETGYNLILITDVRFLNEFDYVKSRNGIVVRVLRDSDAATDLHSSEVDLDNQSFDDYISNTSDILHLQSEVKKFLKHYNIL